MSRSFDKEYGLSVARLIATLFIVTCHIMQVEKNPLALWLNVGVQMFLYMSGYLYGKKREIDAAGFLGARLKRLLVGYYIFVVPFSLILIITKVYPTGWVDILHFLTFSNFDFADGIGHLWFVPCIIVCYALLTLFVSILNRMDKIKSDICYLAAFAASLLGVEYVFQLFIRNDLMKAPWINCFLIGLVSRRIAESNRSLKKCFGIMIAAGCILLNGVQICIMYMIKPELSGYRQFIFDRLSAYAHILLGIVVVEIIRRIFEKIGSERFRGFLDYTDRLSYSVYLVHFVLIKGAFSLLKAVSPKPLAVAAVFVSAIALGMVIDALTNCVNAKTNRQK